MSASPVPSGFCEVIVSQVTGEALDWLQLGLWSVAVGLGFAVMMLGVIAFQGMRR